MKLAADRPNLVRRLVLFDAAGVYFPGYTNLPATFDARDVNGVRQLFARLTPAPPPLPDFVAEDLVRRIQANVWVVKRSMAAMMTGRDLMDFRLLSIRQPTLVIWGRQDQLIPLSSGVKVHRGIENSSMLVLDGCGHLAPGGVPQSFAGRHGGVSEGRSRASRSPSRGHWQTMTLNHPSRQTNLPGEAAQKPKRDGRSFVPSLPWTAGDCRASGSRGRSSRRRPRRAACCAGGYG